MKNRYIQKQGYIKTVLMKLVGIFKRREVFNKFEVIERISYTRLGYKENNNHRCRQNKLINNNKMKSIIR